MGSSTDAHCFACGYDRFLLLGAGMSTFKTDAAWPVRCEECAAVSTANFKVSPLSCGECGSRDVVALSDPGEWRGDGEIIESWGQLVLTNGHYRCPKCDRFELRFGTNEGGHGKIKWD